MRNHCCINQLPFSLPFRVCNNRSGRHFSEFSDHWLHNLSSIASRALARPGPACILHQSGGGGGPQSPCARSASVAWIHIAKWYWTSKKQKKTKCHRQIRAPRTLTHTTELSIVHGRASAAGEMRYAESKIIFKAYTSPLVQVKKSLRWLKSYGKEGGGALACLLWQRSSSCAREENLLTCCRALCCNNQRRQSHLMVPPPLYVRRFYNNIPLLR